MMCSSSCLNWLSFNADSIVYRENVFFDLYLSSSSVVFGKMFLYSFPVGNHLKMFKHFTCLSDEF